MYLRQLTIKDTFTTSRQSAAEIDREIEVTDDIWFDGGETLLASLCRQESKLEILRRVLQKGQSLLMGFVISL